MVVTAIAIFVIWSLVITPPPPPPLLSENQFSKRIEHEIDSLGKWPDSKFCKDFYNEVAYHIDDYYNNKRLGQTPSENEQWKENLTKNLYSAYTGKFVNQAFYVFGRSEWKIEDLKFIRSEYQTLRKSKLLEKGSPVDTKFAEIQTILRKYDEIAGFISGSKSFSFSVFGLSDRFPVSVAQGKLSQARIYLSSPYASVNHCARLHDGLKDIPQTLFRAHVRYLDKKITHWSGMYKHYNSHSDYVNNLHKPLKEEIDALDNDIYSVNNFDREYENLSRKWSADNAKAYNYKYDD
jgi:DNA repair ATPase RecN